MNETNKLYCTMLHLACFVEDAKRDRVADLGKPCALCKIRKEAKCSFDFYNVVETLCDSVGIKINPAVTQMDYQVHLEKSDRQKNERRQK